ncbi:hypothetical protein AB0M36_31540 [Actinoplanes sp. NPDC051346]|uniref:hypothetical protein n=1 Tax=Actinoplanes sp. NPDC051346 TaxID=3155048 RepID=UPI003423AFC1
MARHPARIDTRPVVHYYPVPDPSADVMPVAADLFVYRQHVAEIAQRRERDRILYARWKQRRAERAARDRRNRRILLAVAVPLTVAVLAALVTLGWLLWDAMTGVNGPALIVLVLLGMVAVGGVGHRCITVVQHWH